MHFPTLRLTFLWRFTLLTLAVSVLAALVLAVTIENAHRRAIETDVEVGALGRVSSEATKPLEMLSAARTMTPELQREFERVAKNAQFDQYVTALRIYGPDGTAVFPAAAAPAPAAVHDAIAANDAFIRREDASTITDYSAIYSNGHPYVVALDFLPGQLSVALEKERKLVVGVVAGVVAIIFLSLVTLAAGASRELERRRREAQFTFVQTLKVMAETIDLRDPYTAGHSQRVAEYSCKLAAALGMPVRQIDVIESGALLHDIGKIGIPDAVLFKPAVLDSNERKIIGTHPVIGARLLESISSMEDVVPCVLHHHEKVDGTGYPAKLTGDRIPLGARVIAVADAFDAMTTDRPYRRAMTADAAATELARVAGTQLDAAMVAVFCALVARGEIVPPSAAHADDVVNFGRRLEHGTV